ncbi:hypothetical protein LXA43DRAFT_644714 [Ganoderma leucocontextum]|nr:hypothetical protein LXA43DRAFT_644714 [Ganoderma leucocontextum]
MLLRVVDGEEFRDIRIEECEMFLLPDDTFVEAIVLELDSLRSQHPTYSSFRNWCRHGTVTAWPQGLNPCDAGPHTTICRRRFELRLPYKNSRGLCMRFSNPSRIPSSTLIPHNCAGEMPEIQDTNFRVALAHGSAVVRERHADTFIWWPTELLACFSHKDLRPVNAKHTQRWIGKLLEKPGTGFNVKPVNIEPYNDSWKPIECRPAENTSVPPMADSDVLVPGDYCVYYKDPGHKVKEYPTHAFRAFPVPYPSIGDRVRTESGAVGDECVQMDTVPEDLLIKAKLRPQSQGTCALTGSCGPETITQWIVPPPQACNVSIFQAWPADMNRDEPGFIHVANLISMRQDLYELFLENAFGVDVEDEFNIRIFHPSAKAVGLPARLDISKADDHIQYFLGEHFRWCLNVHFHGGSIEDDALLGRERVKQFMNQLNFADDRGIPAASSVKGEDWNTRLGEGILEFQRSQDPDFKVPWADVAAAEDGIEPGN